MTTTRDFLVEIGTEELPPKQLKQLSANLAANLTANIDKAGLTYGEVSTFATPRRLAVYIKDLLGAQPTHVIEKRGPAKAAAFDAEGHPTLACLGFANSCGVTVEELTLQETDKGSWLFFKREQPGQTTEALLPDMVRQALQQLTIAKPMRWGNHATSFIRPVHWVVLLFGPELIHAEFFEIPTTRNTYGHRFHSPQAINISHPKDYAQLLQKSGHVIADYETRKKLIREQIEVIAKPKGQAVIDEALLDEVTSLVEWPVALLGEFDTVFLKIPPEVIITAMKTHQKYFAVTGKKGNLSANFVVVANLDSQDPQRVIAGNQRVLRARLADAQFFYETDLKQRLETRLEDLKKIVFQKKLGSLFDKAERVAALSRYLAHEINTDLKLAERAERAGLLAKADLVSGMVGEFPELQGVMGSYYAQHDGEPTEVVNAIHQHYQPRFSGDALPDTLLGCLVSIADKTDTLIGLFAAGQPPTGEKDPFGLRRAALSILRILIEKQLPLDLLQILQKSAAQYGKNFVSADAINDAFNFMLDRLRAWYLDRGIAAEVFNAVLARSPSQPLDFHYRTQAVQHFQTLAEARALTAAHKRVSNILKDQSGDWQHRPADPELFEHKAERQLLAMLEQKTAETRPLYQQAKYTEALTTLAALQVPIDRFFDEVMVMVDDEGKRHNRLSMLYQLQNLFLQVADISLL